MSKLIGEILVAQGAISQEQLNSALAFQKAARQKKSLGELLVISGLISQEILDGALKQQAQESQPLLKPIGEALIEQKIITCEQLDTALAFQKAALHRKPLGALLVAAGLISQETLDKLLTDQHGGRLSEPARPKADPRPEPAAQPSEEERKATRNRERLIAERLEAVRIRFSRPDGLKTTSALSRQLVEWANLPDPSMKDFEEIMLKDPVLAAKVLRIVNSVHYGLTQKVNNLRYAASFLGIQTLRGIALSAAMSRETPAIFRIVNPIHFWQHSYATAAAAKQLAVLTKVDNDEDIFSLGLIHEIGLIMLAQAYPSEIHFILKEIQQNPASIVQAEEKYLQINHYEVGAVIMESWGLPKEIILALPQHISPEAHNFANPMALTLYVADCLVRQAGLPPVPNDACDLTLHPRALDFFHLTEIQYQDLINLVLQTSAQTALWFSA
ncbi:MAG: HDOD domain-containing protein [Armatimonadetes bacterium]|nr:HDOD domain-containing protein [Armatimonadota bacterium]